MSDQLGAAESESREPDQGLDAGFELDEREARPREGQDTARGGPRGASDMLDRQSRLIAALDAASASLQEARRPEEMPALVGNALRSANIECHISLLDVPLALAERTLPSMLADARLRIAYVSLPGAVMRAMEGILGRSIIGLPIPLDWGNVFAQALATGQSVYVADTHQAIHDFAPWVPSFGVRQLIRLAHASTSIVTPLLSRGRALGLMSVWANDLRPEDMPVLSTVARQVGIALDSVRQAEQAERRARRLALLNDIGADITQSLDVEHVLARVVEGAAEALDVGASGLWLEERDAEGAGRLRLAAQHGLTKAHARLYEPHGDGAQSAFSPELRAVSTRQPETLDNLRTAAGSMAPRLRDFLVRQGYRSLLAAPILTPTHEALGALVVYARTTDAFTDEDGAYLEAVGRQAAVAISHATLYTEAQSARARAETAARQLGAQAAELQTVFAAIPEGVFVCDMTGEVTRMNPSARAMLDHFKDETEPHRAGEPTELLRLRYLDGTPAALADNPRMEALQGRTRTDLRYILRRPGQHNEDDTQVRVSAAPIRNDDNAIIGAVVVFSDITELHRLERQKDEFLSIASHELKTPLTSLKILTQVTHRRLQRAGVPEFAQLAGMERGIHRMERLINDLLDATRIESGHLALRSELVDLRAVCVEAAEEQMTGSGQTIHQTLPKEPVLVLGDADRLCQVLTNLLSNALKYSPPAAPVWLTLAHEGHEACVTVRDEGAGIPAEMLPQLFERFFRVPGVQVQTGSGVGLGLGLHISKTIIERHGGHIGVASAPGEGATFFFTLPLVR